MLRDNDFKGSSLNPGAQELPVPELPVRSVTDQLSSLRACVAVIVVQHYAVLHLQIPSAETRGRQGDPWRCGR